MGEDSRSSNLTVDRDRLWDSLMRMAEIGALPGGGCRRLGLTPEDSAGRALLVGWAKAMGYGRAERRLSESQREGRTFHERCRHPRGLTRSAPLRRSSR